MVTLEEMKQFLRVDYPDDDSLVSTLISSAEELCASVARLSMEEYLALPEDNARTAVLYAVAYLYEHREEADHHQLTLDLRSLLFGIRKEGF
ncbi:head-tail connector protein [Aerococcaceae bacterium NML190073]|nr:head-tail connector protein [Aerococcaceae bacterium NML190073]